MSSVSAPISDRREAIVDGEFAFTSQDFKRIAALLYDLAGISLPDSKATLVYSRLAKRLRSLGMRSFNEYCAFVASDKGHDESQEMLRALTTNVTRFFREPHHFEDLRANVLEPVADQVRAGRRLRLWSAACSSGQEPYSMAFTVLSVWPNAADLDIRILGTDIDTNVLATASRAVAGLSETSTMWAAPASSRCVRRASSPVGTSTCLRRSPDVRRATPTQAAGTPRRRTATAPRCGRPPARRDGRGRRD